MEGVQTGNLWTWMQMKQLSTGQDDASEEISEDMWLMRGSGRSKRQSKSLTQFYDVYSRMTMILCPEMVSIRDQRCEHRDRREVR